MPPRIFDELKNWAGGANTSADSDQLPEWSTPRARNTFLKKLGEGSAIIGKRRGLSTLNATPITSSPRLWGFQYKKTSGTNYNLLVSDTGRLDQLNTDGTTSAINATAFTSGDHPPIFAVANDLCFIVNDTDQKKTDGTTVYNVGIDAPAAPTVAAAAGGAMAVGTYDVALTYYNANTGHESSRSAFTSATTAGANLKLNVSWTAPSDPQVTHVRVYIRFQANGQNAYLAVAGATPAASASPSYGYVPATTATVLDVSAAQYAAFTILAPSTTENDPPASGLVGPCWHASRLFLFDSGNVYYSNIKNNTAYPEGFNPNNVQPVNPDDGDSIVALRSYKGRLLIFKRFSVWAITGTDPNSWDVELVSASFGCASMQSIVEADGILFWWTNSNQGLAAYAGDGAPVALGQQFLADSVNDTALAQPALDIVCGAVDEVNSTILMAVPGYGETRNTRIIPFNYKLKRFHAEYWNPLDVNALWVVETSTATKAVYIGGYSGQAFSWWSSTNDGVPSGTSSGTVTSAGNTTLTDSTASFLTTGGALKDRYVYALNSDRTTIQRRRITSNTATELTVSAAWDTNPNATYTYVIGGIDFQLDTPWMNNPSVFIKKRFEFFFAEASTDDTTVTLDIDLFTSKNESEPRTTKTLSLGGNGGVYDASTSLYDTTTFASSSSTFGKIRCGCVGRTWRARIRNCQADKTFVLTKVAMQAVQMSTKR